MAVTSSYRPNPAKASTRAFKMPEFRLHTDPNKTLSRALTSHTLSMVYHRVVDKDVEAIEAYMYSLVSGHFLPEKVDLDHVVARAARWVYENQDDEYYVLKKAINRATWTIFDLERSDTIGKSKREQAKILGCSEFTIAHLRRKAALAKKDPAEYERQSKIQAGIQRKAKRKARLKAWKRAQREKALFYAQRTKKLLVGATKTRSGGRRFADSVFFSTPPYLLPDPPMSPERRQFMDYMLSLIGEPPGAYQSA